MWFNLNEKMARIGIDARFFGSAGKGLGRYTQKLIENLEKIDRENDYFVFLRKENFEEYVSKADNFKKILADYRWYGFGEQFLLPLVFLKHKLDLVHFPHFNVPIFYRKPIVVTIHDLILLHFPTLKGTTLSPLLYWIKFLMYKIVINSAIKRAKKVIAVSEFTKNDILKNYKIPAEKIEVSYEACENFCSISQKSETEVLKECGIIKPYILYVGNAYPHKNLETLIKSFKLLRLENPQLNLVLVGKEDYFYLQIKNFVQKEAIDGIIFPGFVPDRDLDMVYKNSKAYVFPSLYEGFGLPPLEAMAKGVPVVSSDHKCMKEVLGDGAVFCQAQDVHSLARGISTVLFNEQIRKNLIEKGYAKSGSYSWEKMAVITKKIYQKINIKI
ncbi:MAG: glycosyl transferase, group 1 [uncultured bacterium]|nr:MAG: glycosyl transferase, group 1 [uncultured bacterium]